MPSSTYSAGSVVSGGSRRAKTRNYRPVASNSHVDESLFGTPHREVQRQEMLNNKQGNKAGIEEQAEQRKQRNSAGKSKKGGRETVQVITKDLIRNLIVPQEDPSGQSVILSRGEFFRIKSEAKILSDKEKAKQIEDLKKLKETLQNDVQDRKNYMKQKDLQRQKNEKLSELEEEEREKGEYLRKKANEQLQEQEDEIKKLNELILNAKCHAIRDAQILEKEHIRGEMAEEEVRLDQMMEVDRVNAIRIDEEIDGHRKEQRLLGATKIMEQIADNEQERLLDLERKDQENKAMQKYLDRLCEEEADKLDRRREEQRVLRDDLDTCNAEILRRKALDQEQDRMIEAGVIQYQKDKAEREAAYEKDQEAIRIEKEREVARLRALQERARDEQAERDALRAKRAQEQAERDWRRKEAGEVAKREETEAMLRRARAQQMAQKEHFLAVQAQRERADFQRVLVAQSELVEAASREDASKRDARSQYADEVRAQIQNKEHQRIQDRNDFFSEGVQLDAEARQRRQRLEEIKRAKLNELRAAGIHEKYLTQIERKINQPQHIAS